MHQKSSIVHIFANLRPFLIFFEARSVESWSPLKNIMISYTWINIHAGSDLPLAKTWYRSYLCYRSNVGHYESELQTSWQQRLEIFDTNLSGLEVLGAKSLCHSLSVHHWIKI